MSSKQKVLKEILTTVKYRSHNTSGLGVGIWIAYISTSFSQAFCLCFDERRAGLCIICCDVIELQQLHSLTDSPQIIFF